MDPQCLFNGSAIGNVAAYLANHDFNPNLMRPYIGEDHRHYVTVTHNGKPKAVVTNAPTMLRKDEWINLDRVVLKAVKDRLRLYADLRAANTYTLPGMANTVLQYEAQSDITPATLSMDGLRRSDDDQAIYDLRSMPLPIVHKDFKIPARLLAASRKGGSPIDTTNAELAGRRCAEEIEKLTAGSLSFSYGGGTVYGYTNLPERITDSLTTPTGPATNKTTVGEVLAMIAAAKADNYYGPYMLYCSTAWGQYLDNDYHDTKGDITLRQRLMAINDITDVREADYLSNFDMVLVEMTSAVARAVNGMEIAVVQWEQQGGFEICFKVIGIQVPQLRTDFNDTTGIVHASV